MSLINKMSAVVVVRASGYLPHVIVSEVDSRMSVVEAGDCGWLARYILASVVWRVVHLPCYRGIGSGVPTAVQMSRWRRAGETRSAHSRRRWLIRRKEIADDR